VEETARAAIPFQGLSCAGSLPPWRARKALKRKLGVTLYVLTEAGEEPIVSSSKI